MAQPESPALCETSGTRQGLAGASLALAEASIPAAYLTPGFGLPMGHVGPYPPVWAAGRGRSGLRASAPRRILFRRRRDRLFCAHCST